MWKNRWALWLALLLGVQGAGAAVLTVGVLGLQDDERYTPRSLEKAYPGHPGGRAADGAQLAAQEAAAELEPAGLGLQVRSFLASSRADLPRALAQARAAKVAYLLLDLPDADMPAAVEAASAALAPVILFNTGSGLDVLRGSACAANLLHTYPSEAMRSDAIAQFLAARSWTQALLLQGTLPADKPLGEALQRSARRYGVKFGKTAAFKLSADPRERELAHVRLLTSDKSHDVVLVVDSEGEFARGVPYNSQQPRPVLGASGLTPLAWHAHWDLNGGPQLSRRFFRAAHRPMTGHDWAAWAAVKAVASVLSDNPRAGVAEQLRLLRGGQVFIDGFKGPRLSFRPWDGQLRQPVFLAHADGVAASAPFDGVLHPVDVLDTLGFDEKESQCKRP